VTKSLDLVQTKPVPYLACQMSKEISSRVAECTRLILVLDEFGGSQGTLDQRVNEHGKHIRV
jgi:hypothetical protein